MSLAERIRESRKITIEVGNIKFFARRATEDETIQYHTNDTRNIDIAINHVTGWEGVKESDLIDGGSKELIQFDQDSFNEAIKDRADWALEIAKVVFNKGYERINKRAENAKN